MESIVERILSDAKEEAKQIVDDARVRAETLIKGSQAKAEEARRVAEAEAKKRTATVLERKEATARLESQKVLLAQKRKVLDGLYEEALKRMNAFSKEDALSLANGILKRYAETGDVVVFAENFAYVDAVKMLPVFNSKNLKVASERLPLSGGFFLRGETADKDVTYQTLLEADRDEYQASIASKIFH